MVRKVFLMRSVDFEMSTRRRLLGTGGNCGILAEIGNSAGKCHQEKLETKGLVSNIRTEGRVATAEGGGGRRSWEIKGRQSTGSMRKTPLLPSLNSIPLNLTSSLLSNLPIREQWQRKVSPGHLFLTNFTYNCAENPGKRGVKPYFVGSRNQLLESHLDEYISLKFQNRQKFWFTVFSQWWEKYPWKLGDQDEPPLHDPAKMLDLASVKKEELGSKAEVEAAVVKVSLSCVSGGMEMIRI